jgi:hypothetical protein
MLKLKLYNTPTVIGPLQLNIVDNSYAYLLECVNIENNEVQSLKSFPTQSYN